MTAKPKLTVAQQNLLARLRRAPEGLKIGRFGVAYQTARFLTGLKLTKIDTRRRAGGYGSDEFLVPLPEVP